MSLREKSASGMFGPVSAPSGIGTLNPASVDQKEDGGRENRLVDEDDLPEEYKAAVDADHYVIYGKASVEQYDEDGQKVSIDALEGNLEQLFKSGNVSRRHKDVRVGDVLESHKLEEGASVEVGDETIDFEAGDVLETGANPDVVRERRDGGSEDDELWLCADVWGDTEIAKDTRVRSMAGDLDGFSVTIYAKETEPTQKGEQVTDVDFHAVTIGSDDAIKNKESRFGLAEYKARFGRTDEAAHGRVAEAAASILRMGIFQNLLSKSADEAGFNGDLAGAAAEAAQKAQNEGVTLKAAAEEAAADASFKADDVVTVAETLGADMKAGDDLEEILTGVEAGDLTVEEALDLIDTGGEPGGDELSEGGDEPPEPPDDGGGEPPEPPDDEDEDDEMKAGDDDEPPIPPEDEEDGDDDEDDEDEDDFEEKLEAHGVVTEEKLDRKMSDQLDAVGQKLDESVPGADEIASKMETGATSSPDTGSDNNARDVGREIREKFGGDGGD